MRARMSSPLDPDTALAGWLSDHEALVAQARARIAERAAPGEREREPELLAAITHQDALPGPAMEALTRLLRGETEQAGLGTSSAHFASGEGVPLLASRLGSGARLKDALAGCVYDGARSTSSRLLGNELSNDRKTHLPSVDVYAAASNAPFNLRPDLLARSPLGYLPSPPRAQIC